jgi:hypothetical protein
MESLLRIGALRSGGFNPSAKVSFRNEAGRFRGDPEASEAKAITAIPKQRLNRCAAIA